MKFKGTILMAAAFLGIVLYYYLVDIPAEKKQQEEKERVEKLVQFKTDQVEEFSLIKKDQTLHLKRQGPDAWELIEPVEARANAGAVSSFLSLFQSARYSLVVEDSAEDLAVYGLKDPSLIITLRLKDQGEKTLLLGDNHPMNQYLYVKREQENKVLLAAVNRKDLDKSLFDLRDKSLLNFEEEEVTKIKFQNEGKSFQLNKEDEQWNIFYRISAKGDNDEVKSFLRKVRNFEVKKFIDENPKSLNPYGLAAPAKILTLETGEESKPLTLLVGRKLNDEGFYGKVADANNVVLLGRQLVETLAKKPIDFISKTLLEFDDENVSRIELRTKDEKIVLARNTKDASGWEIVQPIQSAADSATVGTLLFDLKGARLTEFVQASMEDPGLFGLDDPKQVLTVTVGDNKPWTLELGNKSADEKNYFASRTGDSTVFTIASDTVDNLFRSLHDLTNKKLLSFNKDDVEKILIEYPKKAFELQKKKKGWALTQPEELRKVKEFIGNDILWSINNLEYQSIINSPIDEKESGLDKPTVSVTLWNQEGQKLGKVIVGNKIKDIASYYARVDGVADLYKIKTRFPESLPKDLRKFKGK